MADDKTQDPPAAPPAAPPVDTRPHHLTKAHVDVVRVVKGGRGQDDQTVTKTFAPNTVVKPGTFTDAEVESLVAQGAIESVFVPPAE